MSVVLSVYPPLGLLVVDCDLKLNIDGRWNYIDFLTSHGLERSPDTFMVETPTRGMHLYHRVPEGQPIGNSVGKLAPGVDTRASGGYVVGPGSVTSVGEYRIYRNCPVTPALDALVEALTAQRTHEHANGRPAVSSRYLSAAVRNELPTSRHGARGDTEPHLEPGRLRLGSTQPTVAIETNVMAQLVAAGMESGLPERECVRTVEIGFSAGELNIQEIAWETESATLER